MYPTEMTAFTLYLAA